MKIDAASSSRSINDLIEHAASLRPKSHELFRLLVEHHGTLVDKPTIHARVWGDVVVSDDSIVQCIAEIRRFCATRPGVSIRTASRRGYAAQIDPTVWSLADQAEPLSLAMSSGTPVSSSTSARPTMTQATSITTLLPLPRIAVLPFIALNGDHAPAIAAGLTEDLITDLSRHKDVFVIALHSARAIALQSESDDSAALALGVRYILRGTVQIHANRVQINTRLSDHDRGTSVWSDRFSVPLTNPLTVQEDLSASIVNRIAGSAGIVLANERERLSRRQPPQLQAFECFVLGSDSRDYLTDEGSLRAIGWLEQSIASDATFARAWARLACVLLGRVVFLFEPDIEAGITRFAQAAFTAAKLDPHDPFSVALAAAAHCMTGDLTEGKAGFDRALALGPNEADTLAITAYIRANKFGHPQRDLAIIERAVSLNPYHPDWYALALGFCAFHARAYQRAIDALRPIGNAWFDATLYLALSHAALGDEDQAREYRDHLLTISPEFLASRVVMADRMHDSAAQHFIEVARRAGLPR